MQKGATSKGVSEGGVPDRFPLADASGFDGKVQTHRRITAMDNERVATVKTVEQHEASQRVAAIYADIQRTKNIDFVPNFWRTLATNPELLESVWTHLKYWMHPEQAGRLARLDARTREIIALAVSASNGCEYCVNSHTAALVKLGTDAETLGEIMAIVGLFNMTNSLADGYRVRPDVVPPD
jgi:AhpD family alkylhydroperoxidase